MPSVSLRACLLIKGKKGKSKKTKGKGKIREGEADRRRDHAVSPKSNMNGVVRVWIDSKCSWHNGWPRRGSGEVKGRELDSI